MATRNLAATITIGGSITSGLKSAIGGTTKLLQGIGKEIHNLERGQRKLGDSIQVFGRMGRNVDGLRQRYAATVRQVEALRIAQQRLGDAQARRDRLTARAGAIGRVGAGATLAGGAMVGAMVPGVKEAKHYQTEQARIIALGMGDDTNRKAFKFAKDMKTFGTSALENLELLRDGMSVFADLHHAEMVAPLMAKMKFGNKAVFGDERGEANSQQFMDMLKVIETRGGLKSEAEFTKQANIIQKVISATGGRVGATEWRHMMMTGGLAGKSMSSEALFYTMEHLVQEMGGDRAGTGLNSMYKSLYQGVAKKRAITNLDRFGLIGDKSKVKHDKAGQVSSIEPGALLGSDLFRANPFEWMKQVLLPQLAKKGITNEKQVIDTIGMIVSNSVGGSFLAEMYRQRDNIDRAQKRNMGAQDIDQLDAQGRNSASGKELAAQAKLADVKLRLGNNVLPLYTKALTFAADALERLNTFTEKHPDLANAMIVGVTAVGAALVVIGPVLGVVAGGLALYAAGQLAATAASVGGAGAFTAMGTAIMWVGRALLLNPIGLAITAIAVSALLIYKYWEPIKAFASGLWDDVTGSFKKAMDWITTKMEWFGKKWAEFKSWLNIGGTAGATPAGGGVMQYDAMGNATGMSAPDMPPIAGARGAGGAGTTTQNNTFHITQTPGESSEAFARRVAEEMKRQNGVKQRGSLTDGASQ